MSIRLPTAPPIGAASAQGFAFVDEANAFLTADDILDQVHESESSVQRGVFVRSAGRFAAAEFAGVSTIGGPAG